MRAVAVRAFRGTPEVMEIEAPSPAPGELLVRMSAAGLNPFDWKIADGILEGHRPHRFPLVIGVDGAGRVEKLGTGVSRFRVGDLVFGEFLHDPVGIGTVADYSTVPESKSVTKIPPELDPIRAAALPMAGMTALDALERLGTDQGSSILIVGASGGVGSFATELARARGARVTAIARAAAESRLRSLGATDVLVYGSDHLMEQLRALYPNGVDGLLDLVSRTPELARFAEIVRSGGRAATTVFAAPRNGEIAPGVQAIEIDLHPTTQLLERLTREVGTRRLPVPVERTIGIEEAAAALADIKAGRATGKTVVRISDDSNA